MNERRMSRLRRRSMAIASMYIGVFGAVAAHADQSPNGCNGNGVKLNILRSPASVPVGGTVSYNISIFNLDDPTIGLIACDTEDVDVVFYCPGADGTPDLANPMVITTTLRCPLVVRRRRSAGRRCARST